MKTYVVTAGWYDARDVVYAGESLDSAIEEAFSANGSVEIDEWENGEWVGEVPLPVRYGPERVYPEPTRPVIKWAVLMGVGREELMRLPNAEVVVFTLDRDADVVGVSWRAENDCEVCYDSVSSLLMRSRGMPCGSGIFALCAGESISVMREVPYLG